MNFLKSNQIAVDASLKVIKKKYLRLVGDIILNEKDLI